MNKASGGNRIPAKLFQVLKDDAVKVLSSICQQIWKTQEWLQNWKRSVFIPVPKKDIVNECLKYWTIALIFCASKVMLKILQARLQQYINQEVPDVQPEFWKGRKTRDQIANILWITEKGREFPKYMYYCFIDCTKAFDYVDQNKLWKILKEMRIPEHLTCLLRNLCAGQVANSENQSWMDWFKIGKGVYQGYILSLCLFNLCAEYIMQNSRLYNSQARTMIARKKAITSDMQMIPP